MELLLLNLQSPVVLAFALGMIARGLNSDLELPPAIQTYLAIFLLLAIGLKGGVALAGADLSGLLLLSLVTIAGGVLTTLSAYGLARLWLRDSRIEAAALAAHYGCVSAVTFIAAHQFMEATGERPEALLITLVVLLEIPALLVGLSIGRIGLAARRRRREVLYEVLVSKSVVLLLGGLTIGAIAGPRGVAPVDAMYFGLFQGVLMLFMLDMGMLAAARLRELGAGWWRLALYATLLPMVHGLAATAIGHGCGLSPAGAAVFGTLFASASYIAAPAAVRAGLPQANAGRCITAALGLTFPFNLLVGIPSFAAFARWLAA